MKYTKTIFFYLDDEELNDLDEEADVAGVMSITRTPTPSILCVPTTKVTGVPVNRHITSELTLWSKL